MDGLYRLKQQQYAGSMQRIRSSEEKRARGTLRPEIAAAVKPKCLEQCPIAGLKCNVAAMNKEGWGVKAHSQVKKI